MQTNSILVLFSVAWLRCGQQRRAWTWRKLIWSPEIIISQPVELVVYVNCRWLSKEIREWERVTYVSRWLWLWVGITGRKSENFFFFSFFFSPFLSYFQPFQVFSVLHTIFSFSSLLLLQSWWYPDCGLWGQKSVCVQYVRYGVGILYTCILQHHRLLRPVH